MKQNFVGSFFCIFFSLSLFAQAPEKWNASQIEQAIEKLNVLGNVLYVAAHPDDENTRLITYFANEYLVNTTYISLTRGSGGQNLIGKELKETLGVIRTQELMEARKIDGGSQLFSRAKDFGYSKKAVETFEKWNKEEVLADLVYAIRTRRPDIIINRFDHRTDGTTHGHHTASAILAMEAFELANQADAFPEQLNFTKTWQPKSIYFNDSWFFYGSQQAFKEADHSDFIALNIGKFYPLRGLSNNEIAALSRSQHKSQGFGNTGSRGDTEEYLAFLKGEQPTSNSLFEHIDISWNRLPKTKKIQRQISSIQKKYDSKSPWRIIPELVELHQLINNIEDEFWRTKKQKEVQEIIQHAAGLFLEVKTNQKFAHASEVIDIQLEAINQSEAKMKLKGIHFEGEALVDTQENLTSNNSLKINQQIQISSEAKPSNPFWLTENYTETSYTIHDKNLRIAPVNPASNIVSFKVEIEGVDFVFEREIVFKTTDPVEGEVYKKLNIVPKVSLTPEKEILVFNQGTNLTTEIEITAYAESVAATELVAVTNEAAAANEWGFSIENKPIDLNKKEASTKRKLSILSSKNASRAKLQLQLKTFDNDVFSESVTYLDYPHIENFIITKPAEIELVPLQLEVTPKKVAYLQGAGDQVDVATRNLGFDVDEISIEELKAENLANYDVLIIGIRAYNVFEELAYLNQELFNFAENGGHLIMQYQTSGGLKTNEISPVPLSLGRGRVTVEESPVEFLQKNHAFLQSPNKVELTDFDNWVQERGLYFANEFSNEFEAILGMQDPNEAMQNGSLVSAPFGKGQVTYTGISFFRQLPAGVEGAYKLWANIVSFTK